MATVATARPPAGATAASTSLEAARVIPVLRCGTSAEALGRARRLIADGVRVLELTATTPDWAAVCTALRHEHPEVMVGVGTVRSGREADAALAAGADFLVSPTAVPAARAAAARRNRLLVEGALTPSEVLASSAHGMVKLFPAHVGGLRHLRSLLAVLPEAQIFASGGIGIDEAAEWLDAGAVVVGVGSDLGAPGAGGRLAAFGAGAR